MKFISKTGGSLNNDERTQLEKIIERHVDGASKEFIEQRLSDQSGFDIVLQKQDTRILAASFYHLKKGSSPFSKKNYVLQFGIAVKVEGFRGNVIWKTGKWFAKRRIGWLYPLKKVVGISCICNPRVFENFIKLFPFNYPYHASDNKEQVIDFLTGYFKERKLDISLDSNFCFEDKTVSWTEITNDYSRFYRSRDPKINDYFFNLGVLVRQEEKIFITEKLIVACGYRDPFNFRKRVKIL